MTIAFEPRGWSIESKSLKLYLWHFREEGIFCESLADKIAEDVFRTIRPAWCEVTVVQKARGGITITAVARREAPRPSPDSDPQAP